MGFQELNEREFERQEAAKKEHMHELEQQIAEK